MLRVVRSDYLKHARGKRIVAAGVQDDRAAASWRQPRRATCTLIQRHRLVLNVAIALFSRCIRWNSRKFRPASSPRCRCGPQNNDRRPSRRRLASSSNAFSAPLICWTPSSISARSRRRSPQAPRRAAATSPASCVVGSGSFHARGSFALPITSATRRLSGMTGVCDAGDSGRGSATEENLVGVRTATGGGGSDRALCCGRQGMGWGGGRLGFSQPPRRCPRPGKAECH